MKQSIPIEEPSAKIITVAVFLAFLWGGNSVALKAALGDLPPFMIGGLRFSLATLAIFLWATYSRIPLIPKKTEIIPLIILSLLFTAQIGLINLGTKFTYASHTTVIINLNPFFTAVLAHFFIKGDHLTLRKIFGLIVAFGGVLIVFRGNLNLDFNYILGDLIVLGSAFLLGICNIFVKLLIQDINIYRLLIWQMALSLPIFFCLSLCLEDMKEHHFSMIAMSSILYQGLVIGGFCFVGWTLILKRHSPSKMSAIFFATPLFGVALSHIFLKEPITANLAIGAILVAIGIYTVNRA